MEIYYADTGKKARIPWKDDWAYIIGWINNENIAIRAGGSTLFLDADGIVKNRIHTSQFPDYSNPRTYNPLAFVLWGGYREFESYSFIGPASIGQRKNSRIYNPALEIYDPSMEYVIYTEVVDNIPGIVLFHIVSQQKIVEIITGNKVEPFAFGGEPVWSPDGSSALMLLPTTQYSNNQSLFLFNISGEVQKITNFEIIGPYQWSPDGSYVAFWLENGKEIGILDMDAKSMKVYCMDGDYAYYIYSPTTDKIPTGGDLVWLPNNKQLLVEGVKVISKDPYTYTRVISIADIEKELFIDLKWNAIHPIWLNE